MEMVAMLFATGLTAGEGAAAVGAATAAGATAAEAGAWAAGTTVTAASGGSSIAGILSGITTAGSILSSITGGQSQSRQAGVMADLAETDARASALESERRSLEIRRRALQSQASNAVVFAASGVETQSGQAQAINAGIATDAEYNTLIEHANAGSALARGSLKAGAYRSQASSAETGGYMKGLLSAAKFGIDVLNRG